MPARRSLTPEQEERAWSLWLQRVPQTNIAAELHVSRNVIGRAITRIQRELVAGREDKMLAAREDALAVYDQVQREAWHRLTQCQATSTAAIGYLGAITTARQAQDRLLGLEQITVNHRGVVLAKVDALLSTGVPIILPGDERHE